MSRRDPVKVAHSAYANACRVKDRDPERYERARAAYHEAKMREAVSIALRYAGGDREKVAAAALGGVS